MSDLIEEAVQTEEGASGAPNVAAPFVEPTQPTVQNAASPSEPPAFRYYRTPQSGIERKELPDSYFQPSTADLKAAQASLSARTQAFVNAPLRTQAMREADEKAKRARWPTTTIRVKFSDRSQLEKTFLSTDKIRSVYAFVRGSLREDVKPIKFVLYQTPPKREFKVSDPQVRDVSLADLQLAPSSVLLLRFEDDSLNYTDVPAPLAESVLAAAEDLPAPPNFDATPEESSASSRASSISGGSKSGKKPAPPKEPKAESKVPKWMKRGPKK
ncbi:uncharacterized protein LAESUDRAFT_732758 [Laetiporus sulphureus 93-53]|uniref:UBX domain-containing protein n=1 Tax=Laetiporus sulphureus 93-53 TaxID=1314785 RepID=A0A165AZ14_9APHY|nr:uncharacterized protein LAESUDRAFT_732758 [Laetiporus sulphureus 93-53]KZS99922.1 hypothetical protein LAESUDRAFT_732758 [Laetiporus sulphureus 93-53]